MQILYEKEKPAIKFLIENEPRELGSYLALVNWNTPVGEALTERRLVNKFFMTCLMEVKLDRPQALLWLARYVDLGISNTIRSDWKHSGTWQENLKDDLIAVKEGIERYFNENINFVVKG